MGMDDFVMAAESGDLATLQAIATNHHRKVNDRDVSGFSVLHYAAAAGQLEVVQYLLSIGRAGPGIESRGAEGELRLAPFSLSVLVFSSVGRRECQYHKCQAGSNSSALRL